MAKENGQNSPKNNDQTESSKSCEMTLNALSLLTYQISSFYHNSKSFRQGWLLFYFPPCKSNS